jgi:hypothetical protein
MMSDWNVELIDDSVSEFEVIFKGPKESELFAAISDSLRSSVPQPL